MSQSISQPSPRSVAQPALIEVCSLVTRIGNESIHDGLDITVVKGEIVGWLAPPAQGNRCFWRRSSACAARRLEASACSGMILEKPSRENRPTFGGVGASCSRVALFFPA
jgi:hypothetical protein